MGKPIKTFWTVVLRDLPFGVGVTEDGFTFVVGTVELWFPGLLVGVELWYPWVGTVLCFEGVGLGVTVTVTEETEVVGVGLMLLEEAAGITVGVDVRWWLEVVTLEMVDEAMAVLFFPCTAKINN